MAETNPVATIRNALYSFSSKVGSVLSDIPAEWRKQLDAFKNKAHEFASLYSDLQRMGSIAAKNPELNSRYQTLMREGNVIQKAVMDTMARVGVSIQAVKASGQQLGALPLIPIALVGGVTFTLSAWIKNAYDMKTRLALVDKQVASGIPVDQAAAGVLKTMPTTGSILSRVETIGKIGIALAVLYLAWPYLKKITR